MKYILLETNGMVFNHLVKYIHYHSLSDLLIELMSINDVTSNENKVEDNNKN